jgi:integrase
LSADPPITLPDFLQRHYLPGQIHLSPGSVALFRTAVNRLTAWRGGPFPLAKLTDAAVIDHLRDFAATHSPATVNNQRRRLLQLWTAAAADGHCGAPQRRIPKLREPEPVPEAWTVDEFGRLLAECRNLPPRPRMPWRADWWTSLWLVVYWTACRVGALLTSEITDYHQAQQALSIRAPRQKNRRATILFLPPSAAEWVCRAIGHEPDRRLLWPWPYSRAYLWRQARRIVTQAGLPCPKRGNQLFHRARRTCISYCWAIDQSLAQRQAGHASPKLTERHYVSPLIARPRSAADVLPVPRF